MDARLKNIDRLVASYSTGDFDQRIPLSEKLDDTDAVISMLHMLAQELKAVTISRDYFTNIFNAVSDMVLVLSPRGMIEDLNTAVTERLGYVKTALLGRPVDVLTGDAWPSMLRYMRGQRGPKGLVRIWNKSFLTAAGMAFPVEMTAQSLPLQGTRRLGSILLTAKDVGPRQAAESRLLRAVIDGQEEERARLARDIHDGLGQQLAAAKFLVGAAVKNCPDARLQEKLSAASEVLTDIIRLKDSICYNLMPQTLEDFGLVPAVREMGERLERSGIIRIAVEAGRALPDVPRALQIDLFRVVQEFIANAIRHGEATVLQVRFVGRGDELEVRMKENGKGFDMGLVHGPGRGLRNMQSRVRSHAGALVLNSKPGKGTEARIRVTVNP
jgi:PAS domain S-box-containing protein